MSNNKKLKPIFSGDESREMWGEINNAKTIRDLKDALYTVCCHLQTLEHRLERGEYGKKP